MAVIEQGSAAAAAWAYHLLPLGQLSGAGAGSLRCSEALLRQPVWCDCTNSAPCWGARVAALLASLSKTLQKRFHALKQEKPV